MAAPTPLGEDLAEERIPFAIVGGLAVSVRAEPRLTRDVVVAVADDEAAEGAVAALVRRGYAVTATVEQVATARLATARLTPQFGHGTVVDLPFAACGIEPEIVTDAEDLEILPHLTLPVARVGHLIAMKLLSRDDRKRPQDADDLRVLMAITNADERRRAARAVALIEKRGYARGRDLIARWRRIASG